MRTMLGTKIILKFSWNNYQFILYLFYLSPFLKFYSNFVQKNSLRAIQILRRNKFSFSLGTKFTVQTFGCNCIHFRGTVFRSWRGIAKKIVANQTKLKLNRQVFFFTDQHFSMKFFYSKKDLSSLSLYSKAQRKDKDSNWKH